MSADLTDALRIEGDVPLTNPRIAPRVTDEGLTGLLATEGVPVEEQVGGLRVPAATTRRVATLREGGNDEAEQEFLEMIEAAHDALAALMSAYRRRMAARATAEG